MEGVVLIMGLMLTGLVLICIGVVGACIGATKIKSDRKKEEDDLWMTRNGHMFYNTKDK